MIRNWNYHNLYMDYSSYADTTNHPSDIDMFYIGKDQTLIVGEIKNELGKLIGGQRKLYEKLIDGWKYEGMALFIVHNKYVPTGKISYNSLSVKKVKELLNILKGSDKE